MSDADAGDDAVGIINQTGEPAGEHAGLEANKPIDPQEQWPSLLVILLTVITALLAYFFGPDFNKEQPLFDLAVAVLQQLHWR